MPKLEANEINESFGQRDWSVKSDVNFNLWTANAQAKNTAKGKHLTKNLTLFLMMLSSPNPCAKCKYSGFLTMRARLDISGTGQRTPPDRSSGKSHWVAISSKVIGGYPFFNLSLASDDLLRP
ncbi:hypothetical protein BT93_H3130 [Corymbia citriodora subsp. variegata]|nr:hypothetical protein BT93_H3130 [Corymbia citriodora subsp. variegata]